MKKLHYLFLVLPFLLSCITTKDSTNNNPKSESVVIYFKKTPCYGTCPAYEATIYKSGKLTYNGKSHVDHVGAFEGEIKEESINEILEKANSIGFFELNDSYDNKGITDVPSTTTTINVDGKSKTIFNRHNGPKELKALEALIHHSIKEVTLTKVPE